MREAIFEIVGMHWGNVELTKKRIQESQEAGILVDKVKLYQIVQEGPALFHCPSSSE